MPNGTPFWGQRLCSGDRNLLVDTQQLDHAHHRGLHIGAAKALAVVDRVVRGAHEHANARRIDVAHLGKIELNGLSGLLERQVDGITQAIGVRDIDLAGYLNGVELWRGVGGNTQIHVYAPLRIESADSTGSRALGALGTRKLGSDELDGQHQHIERGLQVLDRGIARRDADVGIARILAIGPGSTGRRELDAQVGAQRGDLLGRALGTIEAYKVAAAGMRPGGAARAAQALGELALNGLKARTHMRVKTPGHHTQIGSLSGGNQQKVIIGRWLLTQPEVLMLDEPTRGIDVGAKFEIYQLITELAKKGKGIIIVSSEMPELLGITDRILVMSNGEVAGIVNTRDTSQSEILRLASLHL